MLLVCPSVVSPGTSCIYHPRLVPSGSTYVDRADVVPNTWTVTLLVALLGLSAVTAPGPLAGHIPAPQSFLRLSELQRHWARKQKKELGDRGGGWGWARGTLHMGHPRLQANLSSPACQ